MFLPVFKQFFLFSTVGIVGTVAHFLVLISMVDIFNIDPVAASTLGFIAGAFINYWLNYKITFKSNASHGAALLKFISVAVAGMCLNYLIMAVATKSLHYLPGQAMATLSVLLWNFFCNRFWTFKETSCVRD